MLAAAGVITLAAVVGANAQDATGMVNDNANVNVSVNANDNVPPTPMLYSNDNVNVSVPDQTPPPQNNPPGDVIPPDHNPPPNPPPTVAPPTTATGTNANVPPAAGKRVKIQHPDLIKFFQDIKKVGDSLFGVLKSNAGATTGTTPSADSSATTPSADSTANSVSSPATQQLEKILSPDMIKLFTSIKKIGTSLFGVRKGGVGQMPGGTASYRVVTADESTCVIAAINAKDQAVIAAKTAETSSFTAAVSARTACQTMALGSADNQGSAIQLCNKTFAAAVGQGQQALATAQKDAWTAFTTATKACASSSATSTGDIVVPDGSNTVPQMQPMQPASSGM